ncbi:uncharacterized protein N7498_001488 [Penicillium cinerascens]|uniref:DUF7729 domain-containing protein n=1 Tax=Penicillium cinerascens TaxID=70096 RepID=A0A9W9NG89_9EURO|nr:uncharacterized protein N7498_001488 [Penicillium cinerascens]KAJ5219389.1 hypothetical protein N7498_001488 [Penicillium cinerascens]
MLILCLLPASTLAQPTTVSDVVNIPRSAAAPSGEIPDDHHGGSSFLETTQFRREVEIDSTETGPNGSLLLPRTTTSDMPTPFDSMSSNFANATCVSFFKKFLSNTTVTDCHAVSLLLENSNSFFHTLTSAAATTHVLSIACSQPLSKCASILTNLAEEMLLEDNCGRDYQSNNSVVQGAYQDLMAYQPMYLATCLTNSATQNYCFVDAAKNTTSPNDYNVYFMPLGGTIGSGGLTCGQCLQDTMNIFAHWATVNGQTLDTTYLPSARSVNNICGAGFVNANVTVGTDVTSGAGLTVPLLDARLVVSVILLTLGAISSGIL